MKLPLLVKQVGSSTKAHKTPIIPRFVGLNCYICMETCSDAGNEEHLKVIGDLQSKLEKVDAELVSEKEKVAPIYSLSAFHF